MNNSYNWKSFKLRISKIYLSHLCSILDLRDFLLHVPIAIENYQNKRAQISSRYNRYSIEEITRLDKKLVLEMSLIRIFSNYENFLWDFFKEIRKVDKQYWEGFPEKSKNINRISSYLEKMFNINISNELECWSKIVENYYRRHAYVHTRGEINNDYIRNVPRCSSNDRGRKLHIDLLYVGNCAENIADFFGFIFRRIIVDHFKCNNIGQILLEINDSRNYKINESKLRENSFSNYMKHNISSK